MRRALLALLVLALAACSGGTGGTQEWRGLTVDLPDGWERFEKSPTLMSVANAPLGAEEGDPGERVVAAQFTFEPGARPDNWRDFVTDQDGELETDQSISLDGVPATKLVFSYTTNGIPTREMVVVIPARNVVILMQPVPVAGQTNGPEVFLEHADAFEAILQSIEFGAPVEG
ncbi:MAG: hypothetical protein R3320_05255 [Nitriliruptorales bacterium]|nr:hypothetical protein [Nitriliruptorales bacterium]